ncbi:hypothetical protein [Bifidobacterium platyrrhinorum]|uniref:DUF4062 domain-containing protein n=1 Tax=Bifidobacterium platyrrhinorum TaxID=2661628 RepID=A0A6L9STF2_9BIFI|nr:hypothetical protein [Bifidobacterium platyrrhinorum]NEG55073.1 hypothetical protein [Bifidobacterium platyrrhinorum]
MKQGVRVITVAIVGPSDTEDAKRLIERAVSMWTRVNRRLDIRFETQRWPRDTTPVLRDGSDGQEVTNEQIIDNADIVIAVFASRLGTPTPRNGFSGTAEEIDYAFRRLDKACHVYFRDGGPDADADDGEYRRLKAYQAQLQRNTGLTGVWPDNTVEGWFVAVSDVIDRYLVAHGLVAAGGRAARPGTGLFGGRGADGMRRRRTRALGGRRLIMICAALLAVVVVATTTMYLRFVKPAADQIVRTRDVLANSTPYDATANQGDETKYLRTLSCDSSASYYGVYRDLVTTTRDRYRTKAADGSIYDGLTQDDSGREYVRILLATLDEAVDGIDRCPATTSEDELNDYYRVRLDAVRDLVDRFEAHEDLGVTIAAKEGKTSYSLIEEPRLPGAAQVTRLEKAVRGVDTGADADGAYGAAGEALVKAAGLTVSNDTDRLAAHCSGTYANPSAFCPMDATVITIDAHSYRSALKEASYTDRIKYDIAKYFVYARCGAENPPMGVAGEGIAASYAVRYLDANRRSLASSMQHVSYAERYTMTAATDDAAKLVHGGTCKVEAD